MQWVGYAELASAVSNAGGLGIVRRKPTLPPKSQNTKQMSSLLPSHNQPPKTYAKKFADAAA
jgi:NAD(P)H-dependent flavin oxidoreductase YrpB (nitropropane dioxygenase family)